MKPLFLSHGSPMTILEKDGAAAIWHHLSDVTGQPQAILAVSAHWTSRTVRVGSHPSPTAIHDFGGFPDALYRIRYNPPGQPELARKVAALIGAEMDCERGLDHGAWMPLLLAWPQANIPVVPLSIQPDQGPDHHYRLGQRLKSLRQDGVLIMASGAMTHNLRAYFTGQPDHAGQSLAFCDWMADRIQAGEHAALLDYRRQAPHAAAAHPHDDHLLPFFVALGAGDGPGVALYRGLDGNLGMDCYEF